MAFERLRPLSFTVLCCCHIRADRNAGWIVQECEWDFEFQHIAVSYGVQGGQKLDWLSQSVNIIAQWSTINFGVAG